MTTLVRVTKVHGNKDIRVRTVDVGNPLMVFEERVLSASDAAHEAYVHHGQRIVVDEVE